MRERGRERERVRERERMRGRGRGMIGLHTFVVPPTTTPPPLPQQRRHRRHRRCHPHQHRHHRRHQHRHHHHRRHCCSAGNAGSAVRPRVQPAALGGLKKHGRVRSPAAPGGLTKPRAINARCTPRYIAANAKAAAREGRCPCSLDSERVRAFVQPSYCAVRKSNLFAAGGAEKKLNGRRPRTVMLQWYAC